ncbi:MAG: hypothetical protein R3B99_13830 [Polyangiales bacterium]
MLGGSFERTKWLAILVIALVGCSDRSGPPPEEDGGTVADGGRFDAGADAGNVADGGADGGEDANVVDVDAATEDASVDAASDAGHDGGMTGDACNSDRDCRDGFCNFPDELCGEGVAGVCESPGDLCPADCPGVCGCDGRVYCNTCLAHASSVDVTGDLSACRPRDCRAMDAVTTGACERFFGFAWNGVRCVGLSGCDCTGSDCEVTYPSSDACEAAYATCLDEPPPGGSCGGILGTTCGRDEYCDYEPSCRTPDAGGTCRMRPEVCIGIYDPVCGCDGRTYGNACNAASAGIDVERMGPCEGLPAE